MKKFAVIDIGSNSVRLMFVADGKVLYKTLQTTRLGEGIAQTKRLKKEAIERTALAVSTFFDRANGEGAERVFAFATAAVRSAENRDEFIAKVQTLCGLCVEVVSGETEAELGILGALGKKDGSLIDIGGASTEIVVQKQGETTYKNSADIGVVRLKDKCGRDKALLDVAFHEAIKGYGTIPFCGEVYAIGGTATTLAAIYLGLDEYRSDKVTGTEISIKAMHALADKFAQMSVEDIAALPCMPTGRADLILGGTLWLLELMRRFGIEKIIVSDKDNLEGYAIKKGFIK